jgi:hypothetical protein
VPMLFSKKLTHFACFKSYRSRHCHRSLTWFDLFGSSMVSGRSSNASNAVGSHWTPRLRGITSSSLFVAECVRCRLHDRSCPPSTCIADTTGLAVPLLLPPVAPALAPAMA